MGFSLLSPMVDGFTQLANSGREVFCTYFFSHGVSAPRGPRPPHYRGLTITLRHNTLGRTTLEE